METAKEILIKTIQAQPDDSTADEILKELAFNQMIQKGLEDVQAGRTIPHTEVEKEIEKWVK